MNWISIATPEQLQDGEALGVAVDEHRIALFRHEGEFYATDNVCTHAFALLSDGFLEEGCIECPWHQARFDIRTGKALTMPATRDVSSHEVRVEGDTVLLKINE